MPRIAVPASCRKIIGILLYSNPLTPHRRPSPPPFSTLPFCHSYRVFHPPTEEWHILHYMTGPVDRDGFPAISAPPPKIPLDRARPPTSMPIAHSQSPWNTSHVSSRVATDAIAAGCAAGMVSPLITMIDRYSGRYPPSLSPLSVIFPALGYESVTNSSITEL